MMRRIFTFRPWDFSGSTEQELLHLQQLIASRGFTIYCAEYLHCGMYSCRMLVPGMSEIYPIDDLVWNNKGTGAKLRPLLLRLMDMNKEELSELFEFLETLGLGDEQLIGHTIGVLFEEQSAWATLRIGELKAMLLLALGKIEDALVWCSWCVDYGALPEERRRLYRLLQTLLNFVGRRGACNFARPSIFFIKKKNCATQSRSSTARKNFPDCILPTHGPEISL